MDISDTCEAADEILSFCKNWGLTPELTAYSCLVVAASLSGGAHKKELMQFFAKALEESEIFFKEKRQ